MSTFRINLTRNQIGWLLSSAIALLLVGMILYAIPSKALPFFLLQATILLLVTGGALAALLFKYGNR